MSIFIPLLGLLAGFFAIYHLDLTVPLAYAPYLAVAVLATLDTALGGLRAGLDRKFESDIFVSGFCLNGVLAWILAYLGDHQFGADLRLVATIVFGYRIFQNLSLIRTHWIIRRRERKRPPSADGSDPAVMLHGPDSSLNGLGAGDSRRVA